MKEFHQAEVARMRAGLEAAGRMKESFKAAEMELKGQIADLQQHVVEEVEVERVIEVPVEKIVERIVEVPVEKVVERIVEKIVEVPVEKIVERIVEVPTGDGKVVERIVEKIVEVEVEKIVEVPIEKIVTREIEVEVEKIVRVEVEKIVEREVEVEVEVSVRDETIENDLKTKVAVLETTCDAAVQEAEMLSKKLKGTERKVQMLEERARQERPAALKDGEKARNGGGAALRVKIGRQEMAMKRQIEQARRLREILSIDQ